MEENPSTNISATNPDWRREELIFGEWCPSKRLLRSLRRYQFWKEQKGFLSFWMCKIYTMKHRFWSVVTGADIPLNCKIGGGLLIPHPNGIVINPGAQIGPNCLIFQQVTIATTRRGGEPVIGGHVDIGAGARILGNVKINDHALIGANAVVLTDVPMGATAAGVPARIISKQ